VAGLAGWKNWTEIAVALHENRTEGLLATVMENIIFFFACGFACAHHISRTNEICHDIGTVT